MTIRKAYANVLLVWQFTGKLIPTNEQKYEDNCEKSATLPVITHTKNIPYTSDWFISLIKYVFAITGTNILRMHYGQLGTNSNPMKFYPVTFSNQVLKIWKLCYSVKYANLHKNIYYSDFHIVLLSLWYTTNNSKLFQTGKNLDYYLTYAV